MSYNENIVESKYIKNEFDDCVYNNDDNLYTYNDKLRYIRRNVDDRGKHIYVSNGAFEYPYRLDLKPVSIYDITTLMVNLKLSFDDGSYKIKEITYGTEIKDLKYNENGEIKTISGIVKNILFRQHSETDLFISSPTHDTTDLTNLEFIGFILDSSVDQKSTLKTIYKHNIRDIGNDDFIKLVINDACMVNTTTIKFISNIVPRCILWNGNHVDIIKCDNNEYTCKVESCLKTNTLEIFSSKNNVTINDIPGIEPSILNRGIIGDSLKEAFIKFIDAVTNTTYDTDLDSSEEINIMRKNCVSLGYATIANDINGLDNYSSESIKANINIFDEDYEIDFLRINSINKSLEVFAPIALLRINNSNIINIKVNGFKLEIPVDVNITKYMTYDVKPCNLFIENIDTTKIINEVSIDYHKADKSIIVQNTNYSGAGINIKASSNNERLMENPQTLFIYTETIDSSANLSSFFVGKFAAYTDESEPDVRIFTVPDSERYKGFDFNKNPRKFNSFILTKELGILKYSVNIKFI